MRYCIFAVSVAVMLSCSSAAELQQTTIVGPANAEPGTMVELRAETPVEGTWHRAWAAIPNTTHFRVDGGDSSRLYFATPATGTEQAFLLAVGNSPVRINIVTILGQTIPIISGGGDTLEVLAHTIKIGESPIPIVLSLTVPTSIREGEAGECTVLAVGSSETVRVKLTSSDTRRLAVPFDVATPPGSFMAQAVNNELEDGDVSAIITASVIGVTANKTVVVIDDDSGLPPGPRTVVILAETENDTVDRTIAIDNLRKYCGEKKHRWLLLDPDMKDAAGVVHPTVARYMAMANTSGVKLPAMVVVAIQNGKEVYQAAPFQSSNDGKDAIEALKKWGG